MSIPQALGNTERRHFRKSAQAAANVMVRQLVLSSCSLLGGHGKAVAKFVGFEAQSVHRAQRMGQRPPANGPRSAHGRAGGGALGADGAAGEGRGLVTEWMRALANFGWHYISIQPRKTT